MVQADAHFAVVVALVTEGIFNLYDVLGSRAREEVGAHGEGDFVVAIDTVVLEDDFLPPLATIDGKAGVFLVAILDVLFADEVGHSFGSLRAERVFSRLGRLEQHGAVAIAVKLAGSLTRGFDEVALLKVNL